MLPFVRLWVWISAFASLAGWGLSAAGQLNRTGYSVAFAIFAVFIFLRRKDLGLAKESTAHGPQSAAAKKRWAVHWRLWTKLPRLFRRPLPLCFAALAISIFLGSVIQPSGNYTGMTYRVPRVLQWLAQGHWLWIHTPDYRMNDRACGIEWMSAPLLLFTNSVRPLFLLNFLPFLLMPGLTFSVLTRLGVRPRVAWAWMWLLPSGYNFILQAGGTANDTFPTVYALAAVDFALRANQSGKRKAESGNDFSCSVLAAALMTGAKASNLPLLLPWMILLISSLPLLRRKVLATAVVCFAAAIVSFLPNAILNAHYCHDWSGAVLEPPFMTVHNPAVAVTGNVFQLLLDNFAPPLFPLAGWWNEHAPLFMPQALVAISTHFDNGFFWLGELPTEDWAGIGFGLSMLLAVSAAVGFFARKPRATSRFRLQPSTLLLLAPWLALLAYCAKAGMVNTARLIAPYYPLLLPLLLAGAGQSQIVRRRWWRFLAGMAMAFSFVVLILSPDRPLWPAKTILLKLAAQHPNSHSISRALDVYTVYSKRSDPLNGVRDLLPRDAKIVGFIGGVDDCDISLWLPLGSRRVEHFLLSDPPKKIRGAGVECVVVGGFNLKTAGMTLDDWLKKSGAELVATTNATLKVSEGPQPWHVVRFKP